MASVMIPARIGSTRFPRKVLAPIGGLPMILHVVNKCLKSKADNVYVVTDSEEVKSAVKDSGVEVIMTGEAATGTDRVAAAAEKVEDEIIINVQGDEPFILPSLIDELIDTIKNEPTLKMATPCTLFEDGEDLTDPAKVKVVSDLKGYALYFSRSTIPFDRDGIGPKRYKHIGVYAFRRDLLLKYPTLPRTPLEQAENLEQLRVLEHGERIKLITTDYKPLSVDTKEDLEAAEAFFSAKV